jgi:hypothetical protein
MLSITVVTLIHGVPYWPILNLGARNVPRKETVKKVLD